MQRRAGNARGMGFLRLRKIATGDRDDRLSRGPYGRTGYGRSCICDIHPKYWGQRLMSEAVNDFCAFLFRRYPLEAIKAKHFKDNPGPGRVLQKASFVPLPVQSYSSETGKLSARLEPAPITRYRLMRPA